MLLFASKKVYDKFVIILSNTNYPLKSHGFRRVVFAEILNSRKIYQKTAKKLVSVYNHYFKTSETVLSLFSLDAIIDSDIAIRQIDISFEKCDDFSNMLSFIDEVLARKKWI